MHRSMHLMLQDFFTRLFMNDLQFWYLFEILFFYLYKMQQSYLSDQFYYLVYWIVLSSIFVKCYMNALKYFCFTLTRNRENTFCI